MLYWIPLEKLDKRYTILTRKWFKESLDKNNIEYEVIEGTPLDNKINVGSFLDAFSTIHYKSTQVQKVAQLFQYNIIKDGDIFFVDDIWMPGIEGIKYMAGIAGINIKMYGVYHAGSNIASDDIAVKLGSGVNSWTKHYERSLFNMFDKVFVGSKFHKNNINMYHSKKFGNIVATGIGFNADYIKNQVKKLKTWDEKENIVLFPHRNHPEKKPKLFDKLQKEVNKKYPEIKFIKTFDHNLSKTELYELMNKSKVMFSAALQENFGYATLESATFGCNLLLPNKVVYPEFYPNSCLYKSENIKELSARIIEMINTPPPEYKIISWTDKSMMHMLKEMRLTK